MQSYKLRTSGVSGARGEKAHMRRSVTIIEENHQMLQKARGMLLLSGHETLDMDYTTALNLFLRMGLKKFFKEPLDDDDLRYLVMNDKAKLEITQDEMDEMKKKMASLARDARLREENNTHEQTRENAAKEGQAN